MPDDTTCNRRGFLQITGVVTRAAATFGIASVSMAADAAALNTNTHAAHDVSSDQPCNRGRMYFTDDLEFATLAEAAERIFPKDELGPGARELGVPYFIDNQLAGDYGCNAREYRYGPHFSGAPTQGYQTPVLRRDIFTQGLLALNTAAQETFKKNFPELGGEEQDHILADCQKGKLPTRGFSSAYFFSLLKETTLAGTHADSVYSGKAMDDWRMKRYPGAQMGYAYRMPGGRFENVESVPLSGMQ